MVKIDILKFNGANLIVPGSLVNVKTFMFYCLSQRDNNVMGGEISKTDAFEIEVIEPNGRRFKTSVQPHTPKPSLGRRVRRCSVYGEVISNIDNAQIVLKDVNLNF